VLTQGNTPSGKRRRRIGAAVVAAVFVFVVQSQFADAGTKGHESGSDDYSKMVTGESDRADKSVQGKDAYHEFMGNGEAEKPSDTQVSDQGLRSTLGAGASTGHPVPAGNPECKRWNAFDNVWYQVNGQPATSLEGTVEQGDKVDVHFEVSEECGSVPVALATYKAVEPHFTPENVEEQVLHDSNSGTFSSKDGIAHVSATVPDCYFQLDFVTDRAYEHLTASVYSGTLADAITGGTKGCIAEKETTTTTSTSTTTSTTAPAVKKERYVPQDVCPDDFESRITDYAVEVESSDGQVRTYRELQGNVEADSEVTVHFTIAKDCQERLTLASYEAESTSDQDLDSQTLHDWTSRTFGEGKYSMSVDVPECIFQVDFAREDVIRNLSASNRYGDRLIDYDIGGETCPEVEATEVTTPPTTEAPAEVQPEVVERPAAQQEQLPVTGIELLPMAALGGLFTAAGSGLLGVGRRFRSDKIWDVD
jgi:hypothetical protein